MSLEDRIKKGAWIAIGGTLPRTQIERAFDEIDDLLRTGKKAMATVLGAKAGLYHDYTRRREGNKPFDTVSGVMQSWFLTLRVEPADEPAFQVDGHEFLIGGRDPWVGQVVGVVYDPAEHQRIALDERYEAQAAAARINEPNLPKNLSPVEIRSQWFLAHGDEMQQRIRQLADSAAATQPGVRDLGGVGSAAGAAAGAPDPAAQLRRLADLHASGSLSDSEYAAAKAKVLDQI